MQKKTKIALAASAAILLVAGGVAGLARAERGGGMMGHGMGMGHGRQMMMQMTERYDANKDGKITQEEIDQNRTSWLSEFDADKNGTLSLDEFKNLWLKAKREEMLREFQNFDRDGNAQVALDEYKAPMAAMVASMDQNNDGALSRDDHRQMMEHHGRRWQGMGDGQAGDEDGQDQQ